MLLAARVKDIRITGILHGEVVDGVANGASRRLACSMTKTLSLREGGKLALAKRTKSCFVLVA